MRIFIRKSKNGEAFTTFSIIDNDNRDFVIHKDKVRKLIKMLKIALKKEKRTNLLAFEIREE